MTRLTDQAKGDNFSLDHESKISSLHQVGCEQMASEEAVDNKQEFPAEATAIEAETVLAPQDHEHGLRVNNEVQSALDF